MATATDCGTVEGHSIVDEMNVRIVLPSETDPAAAAAVFEPFLAARRPAVTIRRICHLMVVSCMPSPPPTYTVSCRALNAACGLFRFAVMRLSPSKVRDGRDARPLRSTAAASPPAHISMRDISNLAITGSALLEPRESQIATDHTIAQQKTDSATSSDHMAAYSSTSSTVRSASSHPTSPRSTRSSRLRRQRSLSNRPDLSAATSSSSLQQLDAVHQQLQAMLTAQAAEQRQPIHHNQAKEAAAATPAAAAVADSLPPSSTFNSPLFQRLMALVKEADLQQQQSTAHSAVHPPLPTTTPTMAASFDASAASVHNSQAAPTAFSVAHAPTQPSAGVDLPSIALSQPPFVHSAAPLTAATEAPALPAAQKVDTASATSAQASQVHLNQQLRQLSEYKEQAVAECTATLSRLQAAMAQLHSLQVQCNSQLLCIEDEYVRAVEQCTQQHTERIQHMHKT